MREGISLKPGPLDSQNRGTEKGRPRKEGRDGNAKKGNRRQKGIEERKEKMEED